MLYWYEAPPPEGEEEAAEQSELEAVSIIHSMMVMVMVTILVRG